MLKVARFLVLMLVVPATMQARGLLVAPSQLGLVGKPGEIVSGVITVSSSRPGQQNDVAVQIQDFTRNESGEVVMLDEPGTRSSRTWLDVDRTSFTTPDSGAIEVRVTARIPKESSGSYWTLVEFSALPPKSEAKVSSGVAIRPIPGVGVPVIVTVLDGNEKVGVSIIESHAVRAKGSGKVECESTVENKGNIAILISGAFTLERKSADGDEELASVDIDPMTSLPGTKLKLKGSIPQAGTAGTQVHTYLAYGEKSGEGTETVAAVTDSPSGK